MLTIGGLNIYPIKSCRGVSLQSAMLTESGLAYDREWMVVREDTGKFISQREKGLLALVQVSLPVEALAAAQWGAAGLPPDAALTVTAPGMTAPLKVPLARRPDSEAKKVTVWEWTGTATDEGPDAAAWFTTYLGLPCRLVRYVGSGSSSGSAAGGSSSGGGLPVVRNTEPEFAVKYETRFSDGYPMLIVTQAALADLNTKLAEPLPMNRFRPNIEVAGASPWAEDTWRDIDVACGADGRTLRLTFVKPCSRCKVTTINQATGEAGDEPLDTLGEFRTGKVLGWNAKQKPWTHAVFFGWNVVSRTPGLLSLGDTLTPVTQQQPADLVPAP
ncbi:hypothetical protein CHLRE_09g389089v5 [Chlamydomonas reinhardtii]|uniref:MOSC domain-containing protein n=1 Tax=Chlamydomonas reinhardtii TaxID=3055 RepID=F8UWQ7_CHLRE|nr:uncharacterized protein CHLRE_09g389089v5 [Chlamydomonas reinhardtii]AEI61922.1 MOSC domain-containing protein [Chlamydomonas reinhardtii]PNW78633.1 hypothetical protein CHLRE_09g389089v5 [Chlamydomonas reinhardtii]